MRAKLFVVVGLLAIVASGCVRVQREVIRDSDSYTSREDVPIDREAPAPPPMVDDVGYFYNALSPYGQWVSASPYGQVWVPYTQVVGQNWRPYTYGSWSNTEYGWTWVSDFSWGWAPFHYGRWAWARPYGWVWVPDRVWGPAWVSWRTGDTYLAWAPLGPGMIIGASAAIAMGSWICIENGYFQSNRLNRYVLFGSPFDRCMRQTRYDNHYVVYNRHRYYRGPERDYVRRHTHHSVRRHRAADLDRPNRPVYRPPSRSGGHRGSGVAGSHDGYNNPGYTGGSTNPSGGHTGGGHGNAHNGDNARGDGQNNGHGGSNPGHSGGVNNGHGGGNSGNPNGQDNGHGGRSADNPGNSNNGRGSGSYPGNAGGFDNGHGGGNSGNTSGQDNGHGGRSADNPGSSNNGRGSGSYPGNAGGFDNGLGGRTGSMGGDDPADGSGTGGRGRGRDPSIFDGWGRPSQPSGGSSNNNGRVQSTNPESENQYGSGHSSSTGRSDRAQGSTPDDNFRTPSYTRDRKPPNSSQNPRPPERYTPPQPRDRARSNRSPSSNRQRVTPSRASHSSNTKSRSKSSSKAKKDDDKKDSKKTSRSRSRR